MKVPPEMTGSITGSGMRMRKRRETLKASQSDGDMSQSDDSKSKNQSKNKSKIQSENKMPHPRGKYANVFLDDADVEVLESDFPGEVNGKIEKLSEYLYQHPEKQYADHAAVVRKWIKEDQAKVRSGTERKNKLCNHEERDSGDMSDLEKELTAMSMSRLLGEEGQDDG